MTIRPLAFLTDGSVDVIYDERQHSGTLNPEQITWGKATDGGDNHDLLVLPCPDGCGATSYHPPGGGAVPLEVQELFVRMLVREGLDPQAAYDDAQTRCERMDGPLRWRLDQSLVSRLEAETDGSG